MKNVGSFCLLSLLLLGAENAIGENIIDDTYGAGAGSFELGSYVDSGDGYMWLGLSNTTITGWTVGGPGDGVDWLIAPTFRADAGSHSVDLKHLTNSSIATEIPTIAGVTYELSFSATAVKPMDRIGTITAGSLVDVEFTVPYGSEVEYDYLNQTYAPFSYQFAALGDLTTIHFTATGNTGSSVRYGPVIDSVSVSAIPEPSTIVSLLSLAAGLAVCAAWRRVRLRQAS